MKMMKWMALIPLVAGLAACDDFGFRAREAESGELRWVLDREGLTKAQAEIPDTNDFILTVKDSGGNILYEGSYGDSPEYLPVGAGSYTLKVVSIAFTSPAFSRPQYGDEQVVVVPAGECVTARLHCTLVNAGIRLRTAPDFLTSFPDGVLYVKQGGVRLMYAYTETRIAYFFPGEVSVILYNEGKDEVLLTRHLDAREILTLSISAPAPGGSERSTVQVSVDTAKVWTSGRFEIGGDNPPEGGGSTQPDNAISVGEAALHIGENKVWLYGYIVGGDLSSSGNQVKTNGITKNTHIAVAERSSVTAKSSCVAVELPKGAVRDALNLVDHPDLIGTRVYVQGNLVESYFGTTGLKSTCDFVRK